MSGKSEQKIIIIAGLNSTGKTTFAREFLTQEAHLNRRGGLLNCRINGYMPVKESLNESRMDAFRASLIT